VGTFQETQAYFQQLLPPSSCDAEDGRHVGHELHDLVDSKPADLRRAIRTFADRSKMLRECGFRNIGDMLAAMFTPFTTPQSAVGAAIAAQDSGSISKEQAALIGSAFVAQLRAACNNMSEPASIGASKRRDSLAARVPTAFSGIFRSPPASRSGGVLRPVNSFVMAIASLRQMRDAHEWFVPMLKAIAVRLAGTEEARRGSVRGSWMSAHSTFVRPLQREEDEDDDERDEDEDNARGIASDRPEASFTCVVRRFPAH
jgi:hypothetical protein